MAFDLQKHDFSKSAELGYTFELKYPDGTCSDAKLTIIGDMSNTVQAYSRRKFQEYQLRQSVSKRKGKEDEPTLEEFEEMAVEAAVVRLIGWEGITENDKPVEFSKDKAREVLTQHRWIRDAIMEEAQDVTNFTPKTLKA